MSGHSEEAVMLLLQSAVLSHIVLQLQNLKHFTLKAVSFHCFDLFLRVKLHRSATSSSKALILCDILSDFLTQVRFFFFQLVFSLPPPFLTPFIKAGQLQRTLPIYQGFFFMLSDVSLSREIQMFFASSTFPFFLCRPCSASDSRPFRPFRCVQTYIKRDEQKHGLVFILFRKKERQCLCNLLFLSSNT